MYVVGQMKIELSEDRQSFTLKGNALKDRSSDHFQLIYEALEIAANSKDAFKADFASMRDELLAQSADWMD